MGTVPESFCPSELPVQDNPFRHTGKLACLYRESRLGVQGNCLGSTGEFASPYRAIHTKTVAFAPVMLRVIAPRCERLSHPDVMGGHTAMRRVITSRCDRWLHRDAFLRGQQKVDIIPSKNRIRLRFRFKMWPDNPSGACLRARTYVNRIRIRFFFSSFFFLLFLFKGVWGIFLFFFIGEGVTMIASSGR